MHCPICCAILHLLFAGKPSQVFSAAVTHLAVTTLTSAVTRMEYQGTAMSTITGHLTVLRDFLRFASVWRRATRQAWTTPDTLVSYLRHRLHPRNSTWPTYKYAVKASTAGDWLSKIPSSFRRIGIKFPLPHRPEPIRTFFVLENPNEGREHRPAINLDEFLATLAAARDGRSPTQASLMCAVMYFCMMRTSEPLSVCVNHHHIIRSRNGDARGVALRFFDKTHKQSRREVLFIRRTMWNAEYEYLLSLLRRVAQLRRSAVARGRISKTTEVTLFSSTDHTTLKTTLLEATGHTLSCMRPGGLMYHVATGQSEWLTIKQGGWSPKSTVFIQAYTRLGHLGAVERFEKLR